MSQMRASLALLLLLASATSALVSDSPWRWQVRARAAPADRRPAAADDNAAWDDDAVLLSSLRARVAEDDDDAVLSSLRARVSEVALQQPARARPARQSLVVREEEKL